MMGWRAPYEEERMVKERFKNKMKDQSGIALPIAICSVLVICLFGLAYVSVSRNETRSATNNRLATNAFYIAEAGANRAIKDLWGNRGWVGVTDARYGGGSYTVTVNNMTGNEVSLTSYGTYADKTTAVEVGLRFDVIPAFLHSYFANTNLHIDNHGVPGMRINADAWSNGNFDLDAGTRLIGNATAMGHMLIGDRYDECPDSCIVYGDLRCASVQIESWGFVFSRDSIPEWGLGPADGDVTLLDTYEKHFEEGVWDGTYDLVNSVGTMVIDGFVEGEARSIPGGTPPGDSTIVALEWPVPNWDVLEEIATGPDGLHFTSASELESYMTSHYRVEWDSIAGESVNVYQIGVVESTRVIWVEDRIRFDNQPHKVEIYGCLMCEELKVKMAYHHEAPDSLPLMIADGKVTFDGIGDPSPIPAYMYGLLYCTDQVHFHRTQAADRVHLKGAEIADVIHNCLNYSTEYWTEIQNCGWVFAADDAEPRIISWRQSKQWQPS